MTTTIQEDAFDSPIGTIRWARRDGALLALDFDCRWMASLERLCRRFGSAAVVARPDKGDVAERMKRYFSGDASAFDGIEIDAGGTDFQKTVWSALRKIPFGATVSYRDLAESIGKPTGARAVASANARNPISIVVPCHRVIHAGGTISGYAGGVEKKAWLLAHESKFAAAIEMGESTKSAASRLAGRGSVQLGFGLERTIGC